MVDRTNALYKCMQKISKHQSDTSYQYQTNMCLDLIIELDFYNIKITLKTMLKVSGITVM